MHNLLVLYSPFINKLKYEVYSNKCCTYFKSTFELTYQGFFNYRYESMDDIIVYTKEK